MLKNKIITLIITLIIILIIIGLSIIIINRKSIIGKRIIGKRIIGKSITDTVYLGNYLVNFYRSDSYQNYRLAIFKFGDLIWRSIQYKKKYNNKDVKIAMAIYHIDNNITMNVNPNSKYYGMVKSDGNSDGDFLNINSLCNIAKDNGVSVRILYNYSYYKSKGESDMKWREDTTLSKVYSIEPICEIRKAQWNPYNKDQMHNKFITTSHYLNNDEIIENSVYVSTSNMDNHTSLGNTGVVINNHQELYNAYNNYFNIMWRNSNNVNSFRDEMLYYHNQNSLNYEDDYFEAFFYPVPNINNDAWNTQSNVIAKTISNLDIDTKNWIKINMWHFKGDQFGKKLIDELNKLSNASIKIVYCKDTNNTIHTYSNSMIREHGRNENKNQTGNTSGIKKINHTSGFGGSHAKNIIFKTIIQNQPTYYIITGSTNLKSSAFKRKANNQLLLKPSSSKLYDLFKDVFDNYYNYPSNTIIYSNIH